MYKTDLYATNLFIHMDKRTYALYKKRQYQIVCILSNNTAVGQWGGGGCEVNKERRGKQMKG